MSPALVAALTAIDEPLPEYLVAPVIAQGDTAVSALRELLRGDLDGDDELYFSREPVVAVKLLRRLDPKAALPELVRVLRDVHPDNDALFVEAFEALVQVGSPAIDALLELAHDNEHDLVVREAVATVLAAIRNRPAAERAATWH